MSDYDTLFVDVTGSDNLNSKNTIRFERNKGIFYTNPLNGESIYSSSTSINGQKVEIKLKDFLKQYGNIYIQDNNGFYVDVTGEIPGISSGGKRKSRKCRKTRRRRKTRKCRKTRRRY